MAREEDLLAKLAQWIAAQPGPITICDVIETRDAELLGTYILTEFRSAAKQAVVDRLQRKAEAMPPDPAARKSNAVLALFDQLGSAWVLTEPERLALLGLSTPAEEEALRDLPSAELQVGIIERVAISLDIINAVETLRPGDADAGCEWIRIEGALGIFARASMLGRMLQSLEGMREARAWLQAQVRRRYQEEPQP